MSKCEDDLECHRDNTVLLYAINYISESVIICDRTLLNGDTKTTK